MSVASRLQAKGKAKAHAKAKAKKLERYLQALDDALAYLLIGVTVRPVRVTAYNDAVDALASLGELFEEEEYE